MADDSCAEPPAEPPAAGFVLSPAAPAAGLMLIPAELGWLPIPAPVPENEDEASGSGGGKGVAST